ncbi:hypothetical protein AYO22_06563 [Fonsecaea multimorphosa]|nr:hypothetical protein AYO22_06563 [Fonsecaea multimorphosa]
MSMSLPRALSPVRLLLVFVTLVSLFLFRSYYLPSPGPDADYSLSSPASFWKSSSSSSSSAAVDDVADVELEDGYYEVEQDSDLVPQTEEYEEYASTDTEQDLESGSQPELEPGMDAASEPEPEPESGYEFAPESEFESESETKPTTSRETVLPSAPTQKSDPRIPPCRQLPGADKVVVMVKTGATEVFARVPEQLVTLAQCVPNFMVFSDMEQQVGEFRIQDALDEIGQEYKENHDDFRFYNDVHAAHVAHGDVSVLGSDRAWALDKWKNIPMLHKAYLKYPDAEWFVTIDADTYLSWANLLLLLDTMDPDEPLYAGCVYWHGPTAFAQGGTGYLLSRNAVQKFEEIRTPEKIADWEKETSTICCGDVMLGVAMGHAGVSVSGAWPMFQVDPPSGFVWADNVWCTPAITWHHVHSYEVEALWQFEKDWINKTWDDEDPGAVPYLYKDVFEDFVRPHISEEKKDWNNLSGDRTFTQPKEDHVKEDNDWDWKNDDEKQNMWDELGEFEKKSVESIQDCRAVCEKDKQCMQFAWHPGTCKLSHSIKMGRPVDSKDEYTSGWMIDRVEKFSAARSKCGEVSFKIG